MEAMVTFVNGENNNAKIVGIRNGLGGYFGEQGIMNIGGGITCYSSSPVINYCTISQNSANRGAGIYMSNYNNDSESTPTITNSKIINNPVIRGVGIYIQYDVELIIDNGTISNNESESGDGGGIAVDHGYLIIFK